MAHLYPDLIRRSYRTVVHLARVLVVVAVLTSLLATPASAVSGGATKTSSVSIRGRVSTTAERDWLDYLQVLAILAALASLVMIRRQLRSSDRAARQERAADQAAIWTARAFRPILSPVWSFMDVSDVEDCISKVRSWIRAPHSEHPFLEADEDSPNPRKNDVNHVFGVIEDAAIRYNGGAVDRDWVERMLGPVLVTLFDRCFWFIVFFRSAEGWPSLAYEWETMVRDLRESRDASAVDWWAHPIRKYRATRKRRRQRRQRTYEQITRESSQRIRIICLPGAREKASDEDWSRARQLSMLLAEREKIDGCAALPPKGAGDPQEGSQWMAVVVPRSIDREEPDNESDRELSKRLNSYLSTFAEGDIDQAISRLRENST